MYAHLQTFQLHICGGIGLGKWVCQIQLKYDKSPEMQNGQNIFLIDDYRLPLAFIICVRLSNQERKQCLTRHCMQSKEKCPPLRRTRKLFYQRRQHLMPLKSSKFKRFCLVPINVSRNWLAIEENLQVNKRILFPQMCTGMMQPFLWQTFLGEARLNTTHPYSTEWTSSRIALIALRHSSCTGWSIFSLRNGLMSFEKRRSRQRTT